MYEYLLFVIRAIVINKYVIYGYKSGYKNNINSVPSFHFPLQKVDLLAKWTKFVNRLDWSPTSSSVICANYFNQKFILIGKRKKFNWRLNPVATIYPESVLSKLFCLPTLTGIRKSPKPCIYKISWIVLWKKIKCTTLKI